ncbi:DUF4752 family protein [Enterobacter cloacae]|uniref:DUF4752 family protein n=1 Tax=Enterobacter cloacae TaxID=550 RepID=UPI001E35C8E1|nr:DUF4752 family protein [Enterobacter cloacae]MCE1970825.1 DUF4752 family protein [Enterobacter cloacae]
MDAFKDFSATDWLFFATLLIVWFYMVVKAYSWLIGVLLRRGWRLWNRKDEQILAMDSFYEAFRLADIEPGQRVVITTESGMQIHILRPKGNPNA